MAFINIFNFKKYFAKPSDAQVARYGHVNALYDASQPKITTGSVIQTGDNGTFVTLNTQAGSIRTFGPISSASTTQFTLSNSTVTSSSIILLSIETTDDDKTKKFYVTFNTQQDGSFLIILPQPLVASTNPLTINFLIIN